MEDFLSQEEINYALDALSKTVSEQRSAKNEAKEHETFDVDKEKTMCQNIEILFESMIKDMEREINKYLFSVKIKLDILNTETLIMSEYLNSICNPCVVNTFRVQPLKGYCIFDMSYAIFIEIMHNIGFRANKIGKNEILDELLSDFYLKVSTGILDKLLHVFRQINSIKEYSIFDVNISYNTCDFTHLFPRSEKSVLLTMVIKIIEKNEQDKEGYLHFIIPHYTLKEHIDELSSEDFFTKKFYE